MIDLSQELSQVAPWSAELPNLYTLELTLEDKDGAVVEFVPEKSALDGLRSKMV